MNAFESIRSALGFAVYPVQQIVNIPAATSDFVSENLSSRNDLIKLTQKQKAQLLLQDARLQKMDALLTENIRLRSLLDSSFEIGERVSIAEIINVDLDPFKHHVIINKGSWDKAFRHQPILDSKGVMGQIVHVAPKSSQVILISDPGHAIPVQVNRTGLRSIALGTGITTKLELPYIPSNTDIREGDLLVTSGLGGRFPPGYPVATITKVINDPGHPFALVYATPTAKLDQILEVLLVWRGNPDSDNQKQFNYKYRPSELEHEETNNE